MRTPSPDTVARYPPSDAIVRDTFGGQQETSNHSPRAPAPAREILPFGGGGVSTRWCSVFV
jgi:hypothetical protein